jgi:two-component system, chemotaxis family, sensor kinase CheA
MSLAGNIRDQLLKSFRAELADHIRTMTDGLLALEQGRTDPPKGIGKRDTLDNTFRAAHSLKGAARAMGVMAIEQLAHALENILDGLRRETMQPSSELYTTCYQALDAIQAVQSAYEAGETTPPSSALIALAGLERIKSGAPALTPAPAAVIAEPVQKVQAAVMPEPNFKPVKAPAPSERVPAAVDTAVVLPPASQPEEIPLHGFDTVPQAETSSQAAESSTNESLIDETVRVDVQKLDTLMAHLSELLVGKIRLEQRRSQLRQVQILLNDWQRSWAPVRSAFNRLAHHQENGILGMHRPRSVDAFNSTSTHKNNGPTSGNGSEELKDLLEIGKDTSMLLRYASGSQERLREAGTLVAELHRQYTADTMHISLVIDNLEQEIKRLRMLPLSTITSSFPRMVRDLAKQSRKEAVLITIGGETELDRRILEGIKDPLVHLLRNAVDHGIETPDRRRALGKSRTGEITISAEQYGKEVVIRISDDGAGLDLEAIRHAVSRQGRKDAATMTEAELLEAIFSLGVSTSRMITDISGRGVGLNVVRNNIENLQGRIQVDYKPGSGTSFTLTLPLALTGTRGLLIRSAGQLFVAPITSVERTLSVRPEDIFTLEGRDTIEYNGRPVTLVRLSDLLELPDRPISDNKRFPAIVMVVAERRMAFLVDELTGEQEVVVKDLGKQLARVAGIAGATVLGNGEVVLILNAADLMKLAVSFHKSSLLEDFQQETTPDVVRSAKCILVVDDSITTRTLEKNILEAAGYNVKIAMDGYEALAIVRSADRPDLVVTDIVMPRMDGFDLTKNIKEDPQTSSLPVILVTSLDSPEDKERGIEVKADAYIVKSSFDQVNLLETIEQLI